MAEPQSTASAPSIIGDRHERMKIIEFALDAIERSTAYNDQFRYLWDESLQNYMVTAHGEVGHFPKLGMRSPRGSSQGAIRGQRRGHSNLKAPTTHEIIEDMAGQGIGLLMPNLDFIEAVPKGSDDVQKGRYLSRMLQSFLRMPGIRRTNQLVFKDGFIIGTGIIEMGWEARSRVQMTLVPVFDPDTDEFLGQRYEPREVMFKNGPLMQQIDRYDFYPDASGTRIQENMEFCGKRFRTPQYAAIDLANAGTWDKEGVARAIRHEKSLGRTPDGMSRADSTVRRFIDLRREAPSMYNILHGFTLWAHLPFRPADGVRNRVITIINGELVENHMNPFQDGNFPVKEFVLNPIAGRFDGLSPAETNRYLQDSEDNLLMDITDTSNMAARNVLLAGVGLGINVNRLKARAPGDVISCNDPSVLTSVPIDTNALGLAMQDMQRRADQQRRSAGSINAQTIAQVDRPTATSTNQLVKLASQRVQLMVQNVEGDGYPWMGKMFHSRVRQFLDRSGQAMMFGEPFPIDLQQIDYEADIFFVGSRFAESPIQTQAKYEKAMSVLGANPQLVQIAPMLAERWLKDGLQITEAEAIIVDILQRIQAFGAEQGASQPADNRPTTEAAQAGQGGLALA